MLNVPTAHNSAKLGDIAQTVIMSGDPLRAKYIADNYLKNVVCYNQVRAMYGYTGYFENVKISVQGSGMGCPSMGIYSKELFDFYNVQNIIRVGTAGALNSSLKLKDIVFAKQVYTNSNYVKLNGNDKIKNSDLLYANSMLLDMAEKIAINKNIPYVSGKIFTSDIFYSDINFLNNLAKNDFLAVEMETAALYTNAYNSGKNALTILSISDNPIIGTGLSSTERQISFDKMIKIALELAINCSRG